MTRRSHDSRGPHAAHRIRGARSRALRLVLAIAATACGPGLAACDRGSPGATPAPSASVSAASSASAPSASAAPAPPSASSAAAPAVPQRRHVSLAGILFRAAYELPLTDEQKALLDRTDAALYAGGAPSPWGTARAFEADLVAGILHSKIDMAKLKVDEASVDRAVAAGLAAEAEALNTLHGGLDAATRQALVDAVRAKRAAADAGGRDAKPAPHPGDAGASDWTRRRLDRLATELDLDADQQRQVLPLLARDARIASPAAIQARHDAMQRRVDALLAEFPKESFDAKAADLSGPSGRSPHEKLDQAATFAAALLPILKLGQIVRFAEQTERAGSRPERIIEDVDRAPRAVGAGDLPGPTPR